MSCSLRELYNSRANTAAVFLKGLLKSILWQGDLKGGYWVPQACRKHDTFVIAYFGTSASGPYELIYIWTTSVLADESYSFSLDRRPDKEESWLEYFALKPRFEPTRCANIRHSCGLTALSFFYLLHSPMLLLMDILKLPPNHQVHCLPPARIVRCHWRCHYCWRGRREPRLAPLLDKRKAPVSGADAEQLRQFQAETTRLASENAGEKGVCRSIRARAV